MTLFKNLFLVCISIVIPLFPISFLPHTYPYLCTHEYEFFLKNLCFNFQKSEFKSFENSSQLEHMKHNFLWYLKIPSINIISFDNSLQSGSLHNIPLWKLGNRQGKGIKIAVLDTNVSTSQISIISRLQKNHHESFLRKSSANLNTVDSFNCFNKDIEDSKKRLQYINPKIYISKDVFEKNHGLNSIFCIQQIAPAVEIIPIHVLDDHGLADIASLLGGIQKAVEAKADILHMGLRIQNIDTEDPIFQKICKQLVNFCFVVIAAGNKDTQSNQQLFMNYEQSNRIISVGAFKKEGNLYPACGFSESWLPYGPQVLMPGQDITCPVWVEKINDFLWTPIDGTSIAAALMSGCLALFLSECELKLTNKQMRYLVQACCDQQTAWEKKSLWGTLNVSKLLFTVNVLQDLSKKITFKKSSRFFEIVVDKVLLSISLDNVNVKTKKSYTQFLFDKKIDSDLAILVEHSIKHIKEFL